MHPWCQLSVSDYIDCRSKMSAVCWVKCNVPSSHFPISSFPFLISSFLPLEWPPHTMPRWMYPNWKLVSFLQYCGEVWCKLVFEVAYIWEPSIGVPLFDYITWRVTSINHFDSVPKFFHLLLFTVFVYSRWTLQRGHSHCTVFDSTLFYESKYWTKIRQVHAKLHVHAQNFTMLGPDTEELLAVACPKP